MSKKSTKWVCKECGNEAVRYQGKCFACGEFNTLEEQTYFTGKESKTKSSKTIATTMKKSVRLDEVEDNYLEKGFTSGVKEFDRVCGGKITEGSFILIGGQPGQGKSTLLSTVSYNVSKHHSVIYVSGEESENQMKKRLTTRMNIKTNDNFKILFTNDIENIEVESLDVKPKLLIVDSINTIGSKDIAGDPGDLSQMKHCTARLLKLAKDNGITIISVSQVTKDGDLAGPKKVEHMVDTVLYLEGDKYNDLRIVSVKKNRFGSDNEVGVFQMVSEGLKEIPNPSEYLLKNRPIGSSGSSVVCISDTRPLLIEVQALVSIPTFENSNPRRTSEGFSRNRLNLLIAVLEKHCNLKDLSFKDVFLNVVGGMSVKEPGSDLGVAMSIYSSIKNQVIPSDTLFVGEIGLAGEVRPATKIEQIIKEAERVGFKQIVIPAASHDVAKKAANKITLLPVRSLHETINRIF